MKTLLVILLMAFANTLTDAQETKSGSRKYMFGHHRLSITLDDHWNFVKKTDDSYELLDGCSVNENCANIQVAFLENSNKSDNQLIDKLIAERKRESNFTFVKSTMTANGNDYSIVDFIIEVEASFIYQTVVLVNMNKKLAQLVYTSGVARGANQGGTYQTERDRFMRILNTFRTMDKNWTCGDTAFKLSYADSTFFLIQFSKESLAHNSWRMVNHYRAPIRSHLDSEVADASEFTEVYYFITLYSREIFKTFFPGAITKHKFHLYPFTELPEKNTTIWSVVDPRYGRARALGSLVFATVTEGNYFLTLSTVQAKDQSINELVSFFISQLKSIQTGVGDFDDQHLCDK